MIYLLPRKGGDRIVFLLEEPIQSDVEIGLQKYSGAPKIFYSPPHSLELSMGDIF